MATHLHTGNKGEDLATAFLTDNGYTILARNWRHKKSEIDIIASFANTLHFVEVKTKRNDFLGKPETKVDRKKVAQMKIAAEAYLFQHPEWQFIQFDIVAITLPLQGPPEILLIEDIS
jgi:putative endonuclease